VEERVISYIITISYNSYSFTMKVYDEKKDQGERKIPLLNVFLKTLWKIDHLLCSNFHNVFNH